MNKSIFTNNNAFFCVKVTHSDRNRFLSIEVNGK
jgi:hypothetical protein